MKQALFYAIRVNLYNTVVAVTTEKPNGRWHGRDCRYNEVTHGTSDQLRGRFNTEAEAEACRAGVIAIGDKYEAERKPLSKKISTLYAVERQEIEDYVKAQSNG